MCDKVRERLKKQTIRLIVCVVQCKNNLLMESRSWLVRHKESKEKLTVDVGGWLDNPGN
jgi:hypothetical protein